MEYDYDKLRDALIRYYEISKSHNPLFNINIEVVKNASLDELVRIASNEEFNIYSFIKPKKYIKK